MAPAPQPTLVDKLMMLPNLARVIAAALTRLITHRFIRGPKPNTLFKDVVFTALRTHLSLVNGAQEQMLNQPTETEYLAFAKKANVQPNITTLSSGLKLYWLGSKSAPKTILYFHGGGYVLSCSAGHWQWLSDLQKDLSETKSVSVVVVGYTLAPHGQYPTQLREAAESLQWLIKDQEKKPSDIIIGGDSAGGNMALSLFSHMLHPHPDVAPSISLSEPLTGAFLISPWTKFPAGDDSVSRNAQSDMVTPEASKRWASFFLGSSPYDNYNHPIQADSDWWDGLESVVEDLFIWGGGGELSIDSIEKINKTLKQTHHRTQLVVQPGAAHEDFIFDKALGYKHKADGTKAVELWISERI